MFVARYPRYKLRTLLIACAAFGALLAYYLIPAYRQRQAAEALTDRSILVYYDRELVAGEEVANFWYVDKPRSEPKNPEPLRWYQTCLRCDLLERVVSVGPNRGFVSDSDVLLIRAFPHLRQLDAKYSTLSDEGLRHVAGLKQLTTLNLDGTKVTDAGLKHLRSLAKLRGLSLSQTHITPAGLEHLAALRSLEILNLDATKLADSDLQPLRQLHSLKYLNLWDTDVPASAIEQLQQALPACRIEWEGAKPNSGQVF